MKRFGSAPPVLVFLAGISIAAQAPAQVQAGAICTASGFAIHMSTFDGFKYDVGVAGMLTLMESPSMTVQIRTALATTQVMTSAVALRFGKTVYLFDVAGGLQPVSATSTGVAPQVTATGASFLMQDGSELKVGSYYTSSSGAKFLGSVTLVAPGSLMGKVSGLCGKFDGNPSNDSQAPDGRSVASTSLGQVWATPSDRNLFVCGAACPAYAPPPTAAPTPVPTNSIPTTSLTCGGIAGTALAGGSVLTAGQSVYSPNKQYRLTYQTDGNLLVYQGGAPVFNIGKTAAPGKATMQADGYFVLYNGAGAPYWAIGAAGKAGALWVLQDNGQVHIFTPACAQVW